MPVSASAASSPAGTSAAALAARRKAFRTLHGEDVLLTARAECYHVGQPDPLPESVKRLQAYAAAGADVLFAPGARDPAEIKTLVEAVAPKPLNLLVVSDIGLDADEIGALGVRRIFPFAELIREGLAARNSARSAFRSGLPGLRARAKYGILPAFWAPDP